jgi:hypothetical protein
MEMEKLDEYDFENETPLRPVVTVHDDKKSVGHDDGTDDENENDGTDD